MTHRTHVLIESALALVIVLFGFSWWSEHRHGVTPAQLQVAHAQTAVALQQAAKAETVYVSAMQAARIERVALAPIRDTLLVHLTDTLEVKRFIAKTDTVLAADSLALRAADVALAAKDSALATQGRELAIALRPHIAPRLQISASALYDPIAAIPVASTSGSLRIIGTLSLTARAEQRFAPGEKPRGYLGVTIAL